MSKDNNTDSNQDDTNISTNINADPANNFMARSANEGTIDEIINLILNPNNLLRHIGEIVFTGGSTDNTHTLTTGVGITVNNQNLGDHIDVVVSNKTAQVLKMDPRDTVALTGEERTEDASYNNTDNTNDDA